MGRCSRGVQRAKALKEPVRPRSALPTGRCFGPDVRQTIQTQANRADDAAAWMALVIAVHLRGRLLHPAVCECQTLGATGLAAVRPHVGKAIMDSSQAVGLVI
jgi:hypothetical protein